MIPFDPSRPLTLKEFIERAKNKEEEKNNPKVKINRTIFKLGGLNRNLLHMPLV